MGIPIPMFNKVLLQPFKLPEKTEGGIVLPEVSRSQTGAGLVLAVGPGKPMTPHEAGPRGPDYPHDGNHFPIRPMTVQVGDTAHYGEYMGHRIESDGHTYIVVSEDDLLAFERHTQEE